MRLHSLIVDDFLAQFDMLRAYADDASYGAIENPVDGVSYPGICSHIPEAIQQEIATNLSGVCGATAVPMFMFMRLSKADVPVPHQAHTDLSMAPLSLMLYLNRPEHCRGGTSLVRHVSGMERNPADTAQEALWKRDTNDASKWFPYLLCEMKPNRAFIFDAALMHRAEPIGGFGEAAMNGRLVLTCFFGLQ